MKLLWPDLYGSAASGACSAPSRAKKAPSAWLRRSSATNSFAEKKRSKEFQEGEVPRFPVHSRPVHSRRRPVGPVTCAPPVRKYRRFPQRGWERIGRPSRDKARDGGCELLRESFRTQNDRMR